MRAIAIEQFWFFMIAFIGFIIAVTFFTGVAKKIAIKLQCFFAPIFFSEVPKECKSEEIKTKTIYGNNSIEVARKLLFEIIECFQNVEKYKKFQTHVCKEIRILGSDIEFGKELLAEILKKETNCEIIEWKEFNCGYRNQIIWKRNQNITSNSLIVLRYNSEEDAIEII